jgi:predicted phage terminase large subunit-like protein
LSSLLDFCHPAIAPERSNSLAKQGIITAADYLKGPQKPDFSPLSLKEFVIGAWHVLEPAREFVPNWTMDAICEHLEAVTRGDITNLVINVPPGSTKSLTTAVMWPAWEWAEINPSSRWLVATYEAGLAMRDSVKCRRVIGSPWYQERYGHRFKILPDEDNRKKFENDKTGFRQCLTPRGSGTGNRADYILCLPYDGLISTDAGLLEIGEIVEKRLTPMVKGFDHVSGKKVLTKILNHQRNPARPFIEIKTSQRQIELTDDHEVYVAGKGYVRAASVAVGDWVVNEEALAVEVVRSVERSLRVEPHTYNIATETHNYFVNGILVHNCDDPHKVTEALSDKKRQFALDWWNTEMSNRGSDRHSRFVIIMQRVHEFDVAGACIEQGYELLRIPQEFEPASSIITSIGWEDPRKEDGELMWPARFDYEYLKTQRLKLGPYGYSGQHQQRPTPAEGGIIKREYLDNRFDADAPPKFDAIVVSVDTAEKPGIDNAYSVFLVFGITSNQYYLIDVYRKKVDAPTLKSDFYDICTKWKPNIALIEDKSSGTGLIQYAQKETRLNVIPVKPDKDKIIRLITESNAFEARKVVIPQQGQRVWVFDYVDELTSAPNGQFMDCCDSSSQFLQYMRENYQPKTAMQLLRGK